MNPGDIVLVHGTSPLDRLVQLFTRSHWNHAALVVPGGRFVEANAHGVQTVPGTAYDHADMVVIPRPACWDPYDWAAATLFAQAMAHRHERYGYLQIAAIVLATITRGHLAIKWDGTMICSELVARAYEHAGYIWSKDPALISPADLAREFDVTPKAPVQEAA